MRRDDWPERLAAAIEDARDRPFEWGQHDCSTWAMDVVAAMTGQDGPDWRGKYRTEIGAARHLKKLGHDSLFAGVCDVLGPPLATHKIAQRGDIVIANDALGVCIGAQLLQVAEDGLTACPMAAANWAWRV